MAITFTDGTKNPILVLPGQAVNPFKALTVTDTAPLSNTETVSIKLSAYYQYPPLTDLGSISDPTGGGSFNSGTETFTQSGLIAGTPTFATSLLSNLVYTPPAGLAAGQGASVQAVVTVSDGVTTTTSGPIVIDSTTPPAITGAVANQPIASGGTIRPFATTSITDAGLYSYPTGVSYSPKDVATISITDGGHATDADGLLTGPGLSKTGVGTYSLSNPDYGYDIGYELRGLSFATAAVAAGQTANPTFEVDVASSPSGLVTDNATNSLLIIGPTPPTVPPSIAGTQAGQTVESGNLIDPFQSVTISDSNPSPQDAATVTVTDANGSASDADGTFGAQPWLSHTAGTGVYFVTANTPAVLTSELDQLAFAPTPLVAGQTSATTNFKLDATNTRNSLTATDGKTSIVETAPVTVGGAPQPAGNFTIHDETSGQVYQSAGDPYAGPVAGLASQVIISTSDNINIVAEVPNVFIHTGSGNDALDVSAVNGNNVLDGSTGSNFMVGGVGKDTFVVDDRSATTDIWSTLSKFHSGDAVTVFGLTQADFNLNWVDGQGAAGNTGLTLHATAAGKPIASFTLVGYTTADLTNGMLNVSFGKTADATNLPGSNYMEVQAR